VQGNTFHTFHVSQNERSHKMKKTFGTIIVLALLVVLGREVASLATSASQDTVSLAQTLAMIEQSQAQQPIIIDHTCTDLSKVPEYWIEQAKAQLRLSYGHTSHGSQPIAGMDVLMADLSNNGLYDFNKNGAIVSDTLSLANYTPGGDLGNPNRVEWESRTRIYLDGSGSDRNVVVWSWCGQANTSEENINIYLTLMNGIEADYPDVTFVYMTGHLNGTGVDGNLNVRNDQIRDYCIANNKILFDFADIESYDPDGNYFLDRGATDSCNYNSGNWADEWCAAHPGDPLCETCSCAHSRPLNCNLKGRAFWWMLARIAGWSGTASQKTASPDTAIHGQTITYTVVIKDTGAPLTPTVYLTDEVPSGLTYVSGTITATAGAVNDDDAPILRWSGVLTPTPAVTVTYAVAVVATTPQTITNSAVIQAQGYPPITSTAMVTIVLPPDYPDLTPSYKAVSSPYADYGERITYTVAISNATGPLTRAVFLTDTVQDGLAYVPGTLTATVGTVNDGDAPTLRWSGTLTPTPAVTVTYAVTVSTTETRLITNTATIVVPGYESVTATTALIANAYTVYLPLVLRDN
jgi:uncharacterized repeat protein (TIGR01451 family)